MPSLLLFGAGKSATVLIDYLLQQAATNNWRFIIADVNKEQILQKTNNSPIAEARQVDIQDELQRRSLIQEADVVISLMPPSLHNLIAKDCVIFGKHLLTASYLDDAMLSLQQDIEEKGLIFLCEMGLDPGIDHMSAMQLFDSIRAKGGIIKSFKSHCGGLVAPESNDNPWQYKISWNPRNIVMAGKAGAVYKLNGELIKESYEELFAEEHLVQIPEIGPLAWYPNRDSIGYMQTYDVPNAETFIRTTLRYPDFIFGWNNIVELKLTDEEPIYDTDGKSLAAFFKEHLDKHGFGSWLDKKLSTQLAETRAILENLKSMMETEMEAEKEGEEAAREFMAANEKGELLMVNTEEVKLNAAEVVAQKMHKANLVLKQLFHLGLNDAETMINKGRCSAADVLQFTLERNLALATGDKDMIVMLHEIDYELEGKMNSINSSLVVIGDDNIRTAMAKTVGLPLGIATKMILNGIITKIGLHIPVSPEIYQPVLEELKQFGIGFKEQLKT